jgi:glutathione S-transferase
MSLRLYDYPASGNCYKVRLALAHLGLEYERMTVDIFAGDTMSEDYGAKNPALATPVLEIASGEHLPESGAILLYLAEGTDLLPDDRLARAQVHRWLFFEQGSVLPMIASLRFRLQTGRLARESDEAARLIRIAAAVVGVVNAHLAGREFLATDAFTVADIAAYGYVHVAHEVGVEMEHFPDVVRWLERVRAQPGHVADLAPYPPNSQRGASQSIYDALGF